MSEPRSHVEELMDNSPPGEMPSPIEYHYACDEDAADARRAAWDAVGFWGKVWLFIDGRRP